jgi:ankyrin repeat protein
MAPTLDPEEDRVREELRHICLLGDLHRAHGLLDDVPLEKVQGPLDDEGSSALHLAARSGHLELLQELLRRKFKVDCTDVQKLSPELHGPGRRTPLHIACMEDRADVVLALINAEADVNVTDQYSQTALHKAVQANSFEVLKVLVEEGKNVQLAATDDYANTPLLLAAELGKFQFVEFFLSKDANLAHASNKDGWTALHLCAHGREMRRNSCRPGKFNTCAKLLLDAKANVDAFDDDRKTPLHRAAQTGDRETVEVLLQHGADVGAEDNCRWTPLHYAAQDGHLTVARFLLQSKAAAQRQNPSCLTPLAVATMENQVRIAELLMSYGADQNLRGKGLASPIMIARKEPNKYVDMLALFELGFISHES